MLSEREYFDTGIPSLKLKSNPEISLLISL